MAAESSLLMIENENAKRKSLKSTQHKAMQA